MDAFITALAAFLTTVVSILLLRPVAARIGLTDKPDARKQHAGHVPLVGGIAIFIGLTVTAFAGFFLNLSPVAVYVRTGQFLLAALLLLVVGVLDDFRPLRARLRLLAQTGAALIMIYGADLVIRDLGALLPGGGTLELGWFAVPFTVFVTVGIINAVNLSDGLDGLCGNLTLVSLLGLGIAGSLFGHPQVLPLINVLSAAVAGFLIFNQRMIWRPKAAVFLGDAGSTLLGFALAWVLVEVSQEPYRAISPAVALWFVVVPVFDTVAAIVRRMADGLSPLSPDTRHLHHLLIKSGFSVSKTIAVLCLLALQGVAVGLLATWFGWSEPLMALILFATWLLFTLYIRRAVKLLDARSQRPA